MAREFSVAVLGATGMVGEAMLSILQERRFPISNLYPLASGRSAGRTVSFGGADHEVIDVEKFDFSSADIGLFSAGGDVSDRYAPLAGAAGCVVIDNTSRFRMDEDVPLVVPEVNPEAIADFRARHIIANPNCSTIQMVVALDPIRRAVGIERINVATYQAVSGAGRGLVEALEAQAARALAGETLETEDGVRPIAFNVIPQIDVWEDNGYSKEEMKMVRETRKIFGDPDILVNPTAVRVPVVYGHSEAVHIETREKISVGAARDLLENAPGVTVLDHAGKGGYPTPLTEAAGSDAVFVGRIREDISHPRGLSLWVVSDNVRKGAALNSVQIAEILVKTYL